MRRHILLWAIVLVASLPASAEEPPTTASALAELDDAAKERFLLEGRLVRTRDAAGGITPSQHATLSLDGIEHDAHIQMPSTRPSPWPTWRADPRSTSATATSATWRPTASTACWGWAWSRSAVIRPFKRAERGLHVVGRRRADEREGAPEKEGSSLPTSPAGPARSS